LVWYPSAALAGPANDIQNAASIRDAEASFPTTISPFSNAFSHSWQIRPWPRT